MTKLSAVVDGIIDLADSFAPLLAGTPVPAIVAAGKRIVTLIDSARGIAGDDDQARLSARRDRLEPLVLAHLDRTIDSLG